MLLLTVQFYRSLLSDVANYVLSDTEIEMSLADVQQGFDINQAVQCDERFAMAVI